jgi:hypothetical protein
MFSRKPSWPHGRHLSADRCPNGQLPVLIQTMPEQRHPAMLEPEGV